MNKAGLFKNLSIKNYLKNYKIKVFSHFTSSKGFSYIELTVMIVIIMILSGAGLMVYNSITHSIEIEKAQEKAAKVFDSSKLSVLNGETNCSDIVFKKELSYFYVIEHNSVYCEKGLLLKSISLNNQNELTLQFQDYEGDLETRIIDERGNTEIKKVSKLDNTMRYILDGDEYYKISIYDREKKEETFHRVHFYFYSKSNTNPERVDKVIVNNIIGTNPSNQEINGQELRFSFTYPDAKTQIILDGKIMKSGSIFFEKKMTALDPTKLTLADIFGDEERDFSQGLSISCEYKDNYRFTECQNIIP